MGFSVNVKLTGQDIIYYKSIIKDLTRLELATLEKEVEKEELFTMPYEGKNEGLGLFLQAIRENKKRGSNQNGKRQLSNN